MIDTAAVAWKEWRELLGQRGMGGRQGILLFAVVFGVVLPLQTGPAWITSPVIPLAWSWAPMFLVSTVIADAIAGERERHTLETLLASRLSDGAILFGKMGAAICYAGVVTTTSLILGFIALNLAHPGKGLLLYSPSMLLAMIVFGSLGSVFVAAIGVLISLRAPTVRQAQQTLGGAILVLLFVPVGLWRLLPAEWTQGLLSDAAGAARLAVVGLAAIVVLDAGLIAVLMARFRRARLIQLPSR